MIGKNDSAAPSDPASDNGNSKQRLTLDWWAVIFALSLTALVVLGLPVKW